MDVRHKLNSSLRPDDMVRAKAFGFTAYGVQENAAWRRLTAVALFVLLIATAWALFVAPHLTALGCVIKPTLRLRPRHTIGTGAGWSMVCVPVSAFLPNDHVPSQDSVNEAD